MNSFEKNNNKDQNEILENLKNKLTSELDNLKEMIADPNETLKKEKQKLIDLKKDLKDNEDLKGVFDSLDNLEDQLQSKNIDKRLEEVKRKIIQELDAVKKNTQKKLNELTQELLGKDIQNLSSDEIGQLADQNRNKEEKKLKKEIDEKAGKFYDNIPLLSKVFSYLQKKV